MKATAFYLRYGVVALLVFTGLLLGVAPHAAYGGGELDGKAFVMPEEGKKDVLTFDNGKFHSALCDKYGFGKGDYTTARTTDGTSFKAETASAREGNMVWSGVVKGDSLEGSYTWTKKGWFRTKTRTKNFTAVLKQ